MNDWFRDIETEDWTQQHATPPAESPTVDRWQPMRQFHPPRRADEPPQENVWTLRNGERLDTPERFGDWLECRYRDDPVARESGDLDRLIAYRRTVETRANQRRQHSTH